MTATSTFTVFDCFLPRTRRIKIQKFLRASTCKMPTGRHFWGTGTAWSYFWSRRTNPSGKQPCGCTFVYGEV